MLGGPLTSSSAHPGGWGPPRMAGVSPLSWQGFGGPLSSTTNTSGPECPLPDPRPPCPAAQEVQGIRDWCVVDP